MIGRRFHPWGVFAVVLALVAQLSTVASVAPDGAVPLRLLAAQTIICHTDSHGRPPARTPHHRPAYPACPLYVGAHNPVSVLPVQAPDLPPPPVLAIARAELPPPATAPPAPRYSPSHPRAPPTFS